MSITTQSLNAILADFKSRGIPVNDPGFYDHPRFISAEKQDPTYLNAYARFVSERTRTAEYDERARRLIPAMALMYQAALAQTGRLGACVDVSAIMSRALEREGIWNSLIKGSLTLTFPPRANIEPRYFYSIDTGDFTAAHAWIMAPPFWVIDVSISLQPYEGRECEFLPDLVCDEGRFAIKGTIEDVIAPRVRPAIALASSGRSVSIALAAPEAAQFMSQFSGSQMFYQGTTLKYVPVASSAPDCSFEKTTTMNFGKRSPFQHYEEVIRPQIMNL